jgi:hypothetical protein
VEIQLRRGCLKILTQGVEIQLNRWMAQDTHPRGGDTAEERMSQDTHPRGGDTAEQMDGSGYSSKGWRYS